MRTQLKALTPDRVLHLAQRWGAHPQCLDADEDGACEGCRELVFEAMDVYYGRSETADDAFMAILSDLMEDFDTHV